MGYFGDSDDYVEITFDNIAKDTPILLGPARGYTPEFPRKRNLGNVPLVAGSRLSALRMSGTEFEIESEGLTDQRVQSPSVEVHEEMS